MSRSSERRHTVLQFACWPDPRGGGISSVTHDLTLSLNEQGWDVVLLYPATVLSEDEHPDAIYATRIDSSQPFQWRDATDRAGRFESLTHLLDADPIEIDLQSVSLIHTHFDLMIPGPNARSGDYNSYRTLQHHIERATGFRPKLVRTRHDDLQGGLDRLMRLTGIDFLALPPDERAHLLGAEADLPPIVEKHVRAARDRLIAQGVPPAVLDRAIDHVWYVVSQLNLWETEQEDADAVVSLYKGGSRLLRAFHPNGKNNLAHIYNGTSIVRHDPSSVDQLLDEYHRDGLLCFHGGAEHESASRFLPSDQKVIFVGRDDPSKGISELVQAVGRLYHRRPNRRVRAIIVGHFSRERRIELCRFDRAHAEEYLLFTGWVDDAERLLSILAFGNVTAVPSHYDPFNLAACESFLAATPCVITESIGAAEVYLEQPSRNGTQIGLPVRKPHTEGIDRFYGVDINSLASQIERLFDDEDLSYRLGRAGHEFVRQHYDYRVMGHRYTQLYELLLGRY
ncbi:MAG: glycosyltransferase family 4 protein [Planctomycetota bacterium]